MAKVKIEMPSGFMDQIVGMGNTLDGHQGRGAIRRQRPGFQG